ncbi:hypothetical protein R3P38DRAFT_3138484 [Favolaschia claudopus]|uniref:MYND-type domain-containing protein n=1 Tax=Favolaschia claudopus TaxID=2862362 RepID=A0AAV9Z5P2_9AGAR
MHPALHLDNLKLLPASVKYRANGAMSASRSRTLEDIQGVRDYIITAPQNERQYSLPALYFNLNPSRIPDLDCLSTAGKIDLDSSGQCATDSDAAIAKALLSLEVLYAMTLPDGIGVDIWPRVWPWVRFLYLYIHSNSSPLHLDAEREFLLDFMKFAGTLGTHSETRQLVLSTPWLWFMVGRTWACAPSIPDAPQRLLAFQNLRRFMIQDQIKNPENMEELVSGAGCTLFDLARVVVHSIDAVASKDSMDLPNQVFLLWGVFVFIGKLDPALGEKLGDPMASSIAEFGEALIANHVMDAMLRALCAIIKDSSPEKDKDVLLDTGLAMLSVLSTSASGWTLIPSAVDNGLFQLPLLCAASPSAFALRGQLAFFFHQLLPGILVDYHVLSAVDAQWQEIKSIVNDSTFSLQGFDEWWNPFSLVVKERLQTLHDFNASSVRLRACDNLECSVIRRKNKFRRCSGCQSSYYCSTACQMADWRNGGHREICASSGTLLLGKRNNEEFTARQRSFLRWIVHQDYLKARTNIYREQALFLSKLPDHPFITTYDYTLATMKVKVEIKVAVSETDLLFGPEWRNILKRAQGKGSGGRMGVDVIYVRGPKGVRSVVIPLRLSESVVKDRVTGLARALPGNPMEVWNAVTRILHVDGMNVVEIH